MDCRRSGFSELAPLLLEKLGSDVDHWMEPTVLLEQREAECPICMEPLWTSTPTAFVEQRGREGSAHVICGHFFCFDCAGQQYEKQQSQRVDQFFCPICRATARDVMPLPDIAVNPKLWFQFLDHEGHGRIDKKTVAQALEAILPLDTENLHEAMDDHCWAAWDKNGNGFIEEVAFFAPGGLLGWVRSHQHQLKAANLRGKAPPLSQPEAWFRHWDSSKKKRLRRSDAIRGLCEAASVSSLQTRKIQQLRDVVETAFEQSTGRGVTARVLSLEDFRRARSAKVFQRAVENITSEMNSSGTKDASLSGL